MHPGTLLHGYHDRQAYNGGIAKCTPWHTMMHCTLKVCLRRMGPPADPIVGDNHKRKRGRQVVAAGLPAVRSRDSRRRSRSRTAAQRSSVRLVSPWLTAS